MIGITMNFVSQISCFVDGAPPGGRELEMKIGGRLI